MIEAKTVAELLSDPTHWGKKFFCVDQFGESVNSCSDDGYKWCVAGAIAKIYRTSGEMFLATKKLAEARGAFTDSNNIVWNDSVDYETMIATVRKAGI